MNFTVLQYVKYDGSCPSCSRALDLLRREEVEYLDVLTSREKLQLAPERKPPRWPLIVCHTPGKEDRVVGGYEDLCGLLAEPILVENPHRYTLFPIRDSEIYDMYQRAVASFWTVDEIDLSKDWADWESISADERGYIEMVLGFFAAADGIVNENLASNFSVEVQLPEARAFYAYQIFNETVHNQTYSTLIEFFVRDRARQTELFTAIEGVPSIRDKALWCKTWMCETANRPFSVRLFAFAIVEGVFFSSSFAALFWLKKRGLMPGLCFSNELISRDEGVHQDFAVMLFKRLVRRPTQARAGQIMREAVELEKRFCTESLPVDLIGMNAGMMCGYVEYVADRLMTQMGYNKVFGTENPLDFMELISMESKTNFFERRVGEYQKSGVVNKRTRFTTDAEF